MSDHDLEQCAAQLHDKMAIAVKRVLSAMDTTGAALPQSMLADLGIAATSELNTEAPWTRDEFRVEAIESVASPGSIVFQPQPLTPWAREVFELAEKLADQAEEEAEEAATGRD